MMKSLLAAAGKLKPMLMHPAVLLPVSLLNLYAAVALVFEMPAGHTLVATLALATSLPMVYREWLWRPEPTETPDVDYKDVRSACVVSITAGIGAVMAKVAGFI